MTTITEIQSRIRGAADAGAVARLERIRPARAVVDLALDWGLVALGVTLAAAFPEAVWSYMLAVPLIGAGQYRLFVLGHDGLHGVLHPSRRINDALARWAIYGPLFVGFDDSRRAHLAHHRDLGTPADPERYIHSLDDKNSRGRLLLFCAGLATFARTFQKVVPREAFTSTRRIGEFVRQRLPVAVAQVALIGALLLLGLPSWSYLALWVAPIYAFVFVPDEIRTLCDHGVAVVPDARADAARLISYHPGALEAWLLAPHAVHYQAEHHLWPGVPYYNLRAASALTRECPDVHVRSSYARFLAGLWRRVPVGA